MEKNMKLGIVFLFIVTTLWAGPNEDLIRSVVNSDVGGTKRALKAGANPNTQVRDLTALMIAVGKGSEELVNALLEANVDVNFRSEIGKTALSIALRRNQLKLADLLINKGADINAKDEKGITSLMWAAYEGKAEIVKYLIDKKADLNLASNSSKTALRYAQERNHKEIIKLLKDAGAE